VRTIRIGCGAGYSGDRIEPAVELATAGELNYLVFECLAERTIALAQQARSRDPHLGYDPLLAARMRAVLPACAKRGVRVITNMGAANPLTAATAVRDIARELGLGGLRIAAITGDDVLEVVTRGEHVVAETGGPVASLGSSLVSANAYIGADPVVEALTNGADVVIGGRVADPSLFVAAARHAFGWPADRWDLLGHATLVGHLLECAGQVTGGYFADPPFKSVAELARLGFPIAEVDDRGSAVITKVAGSGGAVTTATCKEQLLYELHDPRAYVTPDVVADFGEVRIREDGPDRVQVGGATGRARPETLKVSLGYRDGFVGEGQISYAGTGALDRARLAIAIVMERLRLIGTAYDDIRADVIGVDAVDGHAASGDAAEEDAALRRRDVRVRVAARTATSAAAVQIGNEVEALYTNGPAGGGGVTKSVREVLAIASTFVPRTQVSCAIQYEVV